MLEGRMRKFMLLFVVFALAMVATASAETTNSAPKPVAQGAVELATGDNIVYNQDATTTGSARYIVLLAGEPAGRYNGGIAGLEAAGNSPEAAKAYANYLIGKQLDFVAGIEAQLDRKVELVESMQYAVNGVIIVLDPAEAVAVAASPDVTHIEREAIREILTDAGPAWIGAPAVWDGSASGTPALGDGVVIAVLDSGVNYDHPSFAETDKYGYTIQNPLGAGNYLGACDPGNAEQYDPNATCNGKLIGAYDVLLGSPTTPNGEDENGHGSHTASTAGGNFVDAELDPPALTPPLQAAISGVAPHANLITYDVCSLNGGQSCSGAALVEATDIVAENIMVDGAPIRSLNYSISGGQDPYNDAVEQGFLTLSDLGVFVAASAGNGGPGAGTLGHQSPWLNSTGAAQHDRWYPNRLINMAGGTPPADMTGSAVTDGYGPATIVYAGDFSNGDPNPEQCLNPFPAGTWTAGEIVVCDRGTIARVQKGLNVQAGGAGGFVLANIDANGESINGDQHFIPAVHLPDSLSDDLRAWLAANPVGSLTATIEGVMTGFDPNRGDVIASFSSRGPNTTIDVLKPNVIAPGVDILAAVADSGAGHPSSDPEYNYLSGTSMSSPHSAGVGALMAELYPDWSPHQIKSAVMMTASLENVRKEDGVTPANPFDTGAGSVRVSLASQSGLILDETTANFIASNPALGGDPKTLNVASMMNSECAGTCSWTRTVENPTDVAATWMADLALPAGMTGTVTPDMFTIDPGATQELTIEVNVMGLPNGVWAFAQLNLDPVPTAAPAPDVTIQRYTAPASIAGNTPAPAVEVAGNDAEIDATSKKADAPAAPNWIVPQDVLWDNGPLVNSPGTGVGGADESVLQTLSLGMNTLGFGHQLSANNHMADDFTVGADGWTIETITFFAYQTGSSTVSTMNGVYVQIWDGPPNAGGSVVWGDLVTNRLESTGWSGIYRVTETTTGTATDRPIMANVATVNTTLSAGTYWVEWMTSGTLASGPWAPPITIDGQTTTGNALQFIGSTSTWGAANDTGSTTQQGMPFIIEGTGEPTEIADITLTKTVGTNPDECALTDSINVTAGTLVTYCYLVVNTGNVMLPLHDLVDDQLGTLFLGLPYDLLPGEGAFALVQNVPINASVTNTATWTAYQDGGLSAEATDTATVNVISEDPLACNNGTQGFDNGIPIYFSVIDNEGTGVIWTDIAGSGEAGNFTNGSGDAATASSDVFGTAEFDTEMWTNAFDLSNATSAMLHYTVNYQNFASLDFLDVDVSIDGGASWTNELSWNEDHGAFRSPPGEDVTIDLGAYLGNNNVIVRWHYYDPNTGDWDWYAQVDDVSLDCELTAVEPSVLHMPIAVNPSSAVPAISVDPTSMAANQPPDTTTMQTLGISNVGGATLNWDIFEEANAVNVDWFDNFDSYGTGVSLHGVGGWKGWGNDPTFTAFTSAAQSISAPNSVAVDGLADLVQEYSGYDSGFWTYTAWQYIPGDFTGETYFILLNQYDDAGATNNWSVQVHFNATSDLVLADGVGAGSTLPIVYDQWVELRVEIDLDADVQTFFYDGVQLYTGSWSDGVSGGGITSIGAVDLFANTGSTVYYDDMSLVASSGGTCSAPGDIPWVSVNPTNGATAPGGTTDVDVTFDSTGLAAGLYEGNLCITSNDPALPLVVVPVALDVAVAGPEIEVDPTSLSATVPQNGSDDQTLGISNVGAGSLDWTIEEQIPAGSILDVLFDNGPLVNGSGTGVGGADESILQTLSLSMNTLGFGHQVSANNWVADDFTVTDPAGWTIDSATFYAYQSFAGNVSTITNVNWILYDGDPSAGGTQIANGGGLDSTAWATIYRVTETTTGSNTDRAVMATTVNLGVMLEPGTYWLAWQSDGSAASGPWAPPVTINGQATTGNGLQSIGGTAAWAPANDTGSLTQQAFPFVLNGSVNVSCDAADVPWLSVNPTAGSTAGGDTTDVTVSFDATGLAAGTYNAELCIASNDASDPVVIVPVELTVEEDGGGISFPAEYNREACWYYAGSAFDCRTDTVTVFANGTYVTNEGIFGVWKNNPKAGVKTFAMLDSNQECLAIWIGDYLGGFSVLEGEQYCMEGTVGSGSDRGNFTMTYVGAAQPTRRQLPLPGILTPDFELEVCWFSENFGCGYFIDLITNNNGTGVTIDSNPIVPEENPGVWVYNNVAKSAAFLTEADCKQIYFGQQDQLNFEGRAECMDGSGFTAAVRATKLLNP